MEVSEEVRQTSIRMSIAARLVSEAIYPLLELDEDNQTTDYHTAVALSALASVAGSLLAQRDGVSHDKLLSSFWNSVSSSIDAFQERIKEQRAGRGE